MSELSDLILIPQYHISAYNTPSASHIFFSFGSPSSGRVKEWEICLTTFKVVLNQSGQVCLNAQQGA